MQSAILIPTQDETEQTELPANFDDLPKSVMDLAESLPQALLEKLSDGDQSDHEKLDEILSEFALKQWRIIQNCC